MPGGAAVGAATQFRMLATSGMDTSSTVGGLAAFSLLGVGGLLALPLFALPVILIGAPVNRGLENAAFLGAVGFVAFAAFGAVVLAYDAPLRWAGRTAQRLRNWVLRKRPPLEGLDQTLLVPARRHPGGTRQAVVAGAAALRRTPGVRLPVPAVRAAGHREPPASLADPGGLRGGRHRRDDPGHPRRSRAGGGEPDRAPGAGRSELQSGRAGHAHLPDRLVLGAVARRAGRLRPVQDPVPETRGCASGTGQLRASVR